MSKIKITFAGQQGAGKTLVQLAVAAHLRSLGLGITMDDRDGHQLHVELTDEDKSRLGSSAEADHGDDDN